jgi:hypothetical protein
MWPVMHPSDDHGREFGETATRWRSARHPAGMTMHPTLVRLLQAQDGLITSAQAEENGFPTRTPRRRAQDDGWERVAPRVYLAGGHPYGDRARVRAAGLWAGDAGAVSGPAAAWWHGMLDLAPAEVTVTVQRHVGLRGYPGVTVRRRDLDPDDVTHVKGIRLTGHALTALETAITVPDGSAFLDRALQKHVPFHDVYLAYCRNMGARGFARAATLLAAAADRADSVAERILVKLLRGRDHRLESWTSVPTMEDRHRVPGRADRHRDRQLGLAHRRAALPDRPLQGKRPGRSGVDPPALHLARPDQPPRLRRRPDPGGPAHGRRHP